MMRTRSGSSRLSKPCLVFAMISAPSLDEKTRFLVTFHTTTKTKTQIEQDLHIIVPADWERDPFTLIKEHDYFFGRGTVDDKAMAAIFTDALIR